MKHRYRVLVEVSLVATHIKDARDRLQRELEFANITPASNDPFIPGESRYKIFDVARQIEEAE